MKNLKVNINDKISKDKEISIDLINLNKDIINFHSDNVLKEDSKFQIAVVYENLGFYKNIYDKENESKINEKLLINSNTCTLPNKHIKLELKTFNEINKNKYYFVDNSNFELTATIFSEENLEGIIIDSFPEYYQINQFKNINSEIELIVEENTVYTSKLKQLFQSTNCSVIIGLNINVNITGDKSRNSLINSIRTIYLLDYSNDISYKNKNLLKKPGFLILKDKYSIYENLYVALSISHEINITIYIDINFDDLLNFDTFFSNFEKITKELNSSNKKDLFSSIIFCLNSDLFGLMDMLNTSDNKYYNFTTKSLNKILENGFLILFGLETKDNDKIFNTIFDKSSNSFNEINLMKSSIQPIFQMNTSVINKLSFFCSFLCKYPNQILIHPNFCYKTNFKYFGGMGYINILKEINFFLESLSINCDFNYNNLIFWMKEKEKIEEKKEFYKCKYCGQEKVLNEDAFEKNGFNFCSIKCLKSF